MNDSLKPCPFCGSKDVHLFKVYCDYGDELWCECLNCEANAKSSFDDEQEAIDAWNRRVEPTFTPDELDAIRRNVSDWRAERELSKIEQAIIDKCNAALKGGSVE